MIITSGTGNKFTFSGKNVRFNFYNILVCMKSKSFYNMIVEDDSTRFKSLVRIPKEEFERLCQEIDENSSKASKTITYIFERKYWGKFICRDYIHAYHVGRKNSYIVSNDDGNLTIVDNEIGDGTVIDGEFEAVRKICESIYAFTDDAVYKIKEIGYGTFEIKTMK